MNNERIASLLEQLAAEFRGNGARAATGPMRTPEISDLSSERDDPEVRFDPRDWIKSGGESMKGRRYSQCPAGFLEDLAGALEYFAKKDDEAGATDKNGGPKSKWNRLNAARARAWAKRKREQGGSTDTPRSPSDDDAPFGGHDDSDLPF